jgi:Acetyltransferase (GNAT) domain
MSDTIEISVVTTRTKRAITAMAKRVMAMFQLCGDAISKTWAREDAILNASFVVYASKMTDSGYSLRGQEIAKRRRLIATDVGFVLVKESADAYYIDLICATGVGKRLIEYIKDMARVNKKSFVLLSAMPNVISFYRSLGFKNSEKMCNELEEVTAAATQFQTDPRYRFKTNEEAKTNKEYKQFLELLIKHQLTHDKFCGNVQGCSVNGYAMTYCV